VGEYASGAGAHSRVFHGACDIHERPCRRSAPAPNRSNASAESAAVLSEERSQVQQALQGLPRRTREVLVLRYYLDLAFAEIAQILGISESSARATSSRGLAILTERLEELR